MSSSYSRACWFRLSFFIVCFLNKASLFVLGLVSLCFCVLFVCCLVVSTSATDCLETQNDLLFLSGTLNFTHSLTQISCNACNVLFVLMIITHLWKQNIERLCKAWLFIIVKLFSAHKNAVNCVDF